MSKPTGQQLVDWCMKLQGKPYIFGTEQDGKPVERISAEDCSEMMQNCTTQNGVIPPLPDGAKYQQAYCCKHGMEINLEDAYSTPGALLFIGDPAHHVGMSRGIKESVKVKNKATGEVVDRGMVWSTIEAKGADWGVVVESAERFDSACLIPSVDYGPEWEDV